MIIHIGVLYITTSSIDSLFSNILLPRNTDNKVYKDIDMFLTVTLLLKIKQRFKIPCHIVSVQEIVMDEYRISLIG